MLGFPTWSTMMLCSGKVASEVKDMCNLRPPVLCGLRPALTRIRHAPDNASSYLAFAPLRRNPLERIGR
jgi:hypothetical protein